MQGMQRKKNPALCKETILKKSRKLAKIAVFFWILPEKLLCWEPRFFALHLVHQNPNFELSKSTIHQFFWIFTIRGTGPLWFRTSQKLTTTLKMVKKIKNKSILWTELQMDQKFRWHSMFKRLDQNKNLPSGWVCNPLLPWELGQNDHHIASVRFWTILGHIKGIFKVKSLPIIFD